MKLISSKIHELLELPAKAIKLLVQSEATKHLSGLLAKFIATLGLSLDDNLVNGLVLALSGAIVYIIIHWVTSLFGGKKDDSSDSDSILSEVNREIDSDIDLSSNSECCDYDFSCEDCCIFE
jgi:hypothetical protein